MIQFASTPLSRSEKGLVAIMGLCVVAIHYPGQTSVDTILQLQDGMTGVYDSNQPPAMSFLLARLGLPGMLVLQVLLFSLSVGQLLRLTPAHHGPRYVATITLFCYPVLLIYVGTLWKDVLFAHSALLALLLLPGQHRSHPVALVLSGALLALGVSVRPHGGLVVLVAGALYLFLAHGPRPVGPGRINRFAVWITAFVLCAGAIKVAVDTSGDRSRSQSFIGPLYQLALFDLGGIAASRPELQFPALAAVAPEVAAAHRPTRERLMAVLKEYSPERQDHMGPALEKTAIWLPHDALFVDWRTSILGHPGAYLIHRLKVLSWILGCHRVSACVPYALGLSPNPAPLVEEVGIVPGTSRRAGLLKRLGEATMPLFRPVIYIVLSLALTVFLWRLDWRRHCLILVVQWSALAYSASYLLVGIACDFRYTFFSTLAALFGLAYAIVVGSALTRRDDSRTG